MASPLMMALEAEQGVAMETEYSYFISTDTDQLAKIAELITTCEHYMFYEGKLTYDKKTGAMSRIRQYIRDKEKTYELTTKHKTDDSKSKVESNIILDDMNFNQLATLVTSSYVRIRAELPVTRSDGTVVMRGEKPLVWEIDLYIDARGSGYKEIHPWIKVELEVDNATLDSVVDLIPFEYSQLISSDTTQPEDRALIDNLYSNEYDLVNSKVDLSGSGEILSLLIDK